MECLFCTITGHDGGSFDWGALIGGVANIIAAVVAVGGVVFAANRATTSVMAPLELQRQSKVDDQISRGDALIEEAYTRSTHLEWVGDVLTDLQADDDLEERLRSVWDNIDTGTLATLDRISKFVDRAWPELASVASSQRAGLAECLGQVDIAIENIIRLKLNADWVMVEIAKRRSTMNDPALGTSDKEIFQTMNIFIASLVSFTEGIRDAIRSINDYFESIGKVPPAPLDSTQQG